MKQNIDFRLIFLFVLLPMALAILSALAALLLRVLAPRQCRTARLLLCLPLLGLLVGVPVALIANMAPDLVAWMGTACMSFVMLIGFAILGIATLVRAAAGWPEPKKKRMRKRTDPEDEYGD